MGRYFVLSAHGAEGKAKSRYRDFNTFLRRQFGCRIHKISIDAGFTCPNRDGTLSEGGCIYCDARGSGTGLWARDVSISEQIESAATLLKRKYKAGGYLAYFQSFTNTYAPIERLKTLYDEALSLPGIVGLCIGTRPDCIDQATLDLVASYAARWMIWLEIGLQSAHDETLLLINRGHDFRCFVRAVRQAAERNILICTHLILGLPGEGPDRVLETAHRISSLPLHALKLHSQYIVAGTKLESMFHDGVYQPWSREEYADSVCNVLERIPEQWVIQRLTGDPPRKSLIAPQWSLDKQGTLGAIQAYLEARDTWQGRLMGAARP